MGIWDWAFRVGRLGIGLDVWDWAFGIGCLGLGVDCALYIRCPLLEVSLFSLLLVHQLIY